MVEKYEVHIEYDDERDKYFIYLNDDNSDVQCFFSCDEAPTIKFTRNLKEVKNVLDASEYV